MTGYESVWEIRKSVGPEQDWTGEVESWMGSLGSDSFKNIAKSLLLVQSIPIDEADG